MAYIEFHQALIDHRKTIIAAEILDMQEVHLCGHLAALWCWCLDNCQDGILPESHRVIARGARYTEDPSKFIEALVTAGFVTKTESGLAIHDWSNYGGKLIEKRRTNAEKQARYRDRQDQENKPEGDVTATLPSRNALEKSREEKRRVLPPISPEGGPPEAPKSIRSVKTRVPENMVAVIPPEVWSAIAKEQGMSPDEVIRETEKMTDHYRANGERKVDWVATWRNWMRSDFRKPKPQNDIPHNKGGIMRVVL